jgi:ATP-dependent DNA ligase
VRPLPNLHGEAVPRCLKIECCFPVCCKCSQLHTADKMGTHACAFEMQVSTGAEDVFAHMTKRFGDMPACVCEYKYDGQRAMIHILPGRSGVKVFSRHGHETTASLPDVVDLALRVAHRACVDDAIIDAEIVAVEGGRPRYAHGGLLPFQKLASRARASVSLDDVQVEVRECVSVACVQIGYMA